MVIGPEITRHLKAAAEVVYDWIDEQAGRVATEVDGELWEAPAVWLLVRSAIRQEEVWP